MDISNFYQTELWGQVEEFATIWPVDVLDAFVDCHDELHLGILLLLIQETANQAYIHRARPEEHGFSSTMRWYLAWNCLRNLRLPRRNERIKFITWVNDVERVIFSRDTVVVDAEGRCIIAVNAGWFIIDRATKRPVPASGLSSMFPIARPNPPLWRPMRQRLRFQMDALRPADWDLPKSVLAQPGNCHRTIPRENRPVYFSEIDRNGHMNNTAYGNRIADRFDNVKGTNGRVTGIDISYLSEAVHGTQISTYGEVLELSPRTEITPVDVMGSLPVDRVALLFGEKREPATNADESPGEACFRSRVLLTKA
ncbi:MAG: hypothetical protein GX907_00545 [Clostridiaceae bacterium]|nr:hypothetical protein [Clostridiaceae bacterium]